MLKRNPSEIESEQRLEPKMLLAQEGELGDGDGNESSPGSRKRKKKRKRDKKHHHHHHRSDDSDTALNSSLSAEKTAVQYAFDSIATGNSPSYRPTEDGYGAYDAYDKYAHKSAYNNSTKSEAPETNDGDSDGSGSCYSDFEFCTSKGANLEGAGADYDDESFYGVSFDPKKHQQRLQSSMEEYHNQPSPHPYPSIPTRVSISPPSILLLRSVAIHGDTFDF